MSSAKRKCMQYSGSYLQYGFIPATHCELQLVCLLCSKVFSNKAMKPSRLCEDLPKIHPDKADKRAKFFLCLWDNFKKQKTIDSIFPSSSHRSVDGLLASYNTFYHSGHLNQSLKTVIKAVNKIKAHALNTGLFKQLRNENNEAFESGTGNTSYRNTMAFKKQLLCTF